jgi:DNA-binding LacI/PurR family transcriptional regulator
MADLLVRRISGEEPTRQTILPVELILRDTA